MNRDFLKGAVFATGLCLVLYGMFPGAAAPQRNRRHRPTRVVRLGGWQIPRKQHKRSETVRFASARDDRAETHAHLGRSETPSRKPGRRNVAAYRGLGSWIDVFNSWVWAHPWRTVAKMHRRGVETIYLQTATHGSSNAVVHPKAVKQFLVGAHRKDMRVVGWYVPSFTRPDRDLRRARAGMLFHSKNGQRFDSFALDIEAPNVDNIVKRNARLLRISRELRRIAGEEYPLGAIIPDSHSLYWPSFPYKDVAAIYDVMVPMGYFTFRAEGFAHVERYTEHNIRTIRKETGNRATPIHVIGGIADEVGVPAARGFARAVKEKKVLGASLYDYPITTEKAWNELSDRI